MSRAMRGGVLVSVGVVAAVLLAGCPMPINYSGEGAGSDVQSDPSSPGVTPPVEITYSEAGGRSGSLSDLDSFAGTNDTQVTLSTSVDGGTVYYTTDGSPLDDLSAARSASGSDTVDVSISSPGGGNPTATTLTLRAIAVAPGRRPSPEVQVTITVDYDTYAVVYDANGGSNAPVDSAVYKIGDEISVASGTPGRSGFAFLEWNTAQDGGGQSFSAGDTLVLGTDVPAGDVTLYAQWDQVRFSVTYDANGGVGPLPTDNQSHTEGDLVTVKAVPTDPGAVFFNPNGSLAGVPAGAASAVLRSNDTEAALGFAGWKTDPNGQAAEFWPGETFVIVEDTTLYAHYQDYTADGSQRGPAGGRVMFDFGNYSRGFRYLEIDTENLGSFRLMAGTNNVNGIDPMTPPEYPDVGAGYENTMAYKDFFSGNFNTGIDAAVAHVKNGYDDWFVPAVETLDFLQSRIPEVNAAPGAEQITDGDVFWSSTQATDGETADIAPNVWALQYDWQNGQFNPAVLIENGANSANQFLVRPVRRF